MSKLRTFWQEGGRTMAIVAGVFVALTIASIVALWIAGFVFFALARHNPFLAGGFGYLDAVMDWKHGLLPGYGKRLAIAGVIGGLVPFVGPLVLVQIVRAQSEVRELHGSARFANEQEIRKAKLL